MVAAMTSIWQTGPAFRLTLSVLLIGPHFDSPVRDGASLPVGARKAELAQVFEARVLQQAEDDPSLRSLMVARDGLCDERWKSIVDGGNGPVAPDASPSNTFTTLWAQDNLARPGHDLHRAGHRVCPNIGGNFDGVPYQ
jgi:hypothetical protein